MSDTFDDAPLLSERERDQATEIDRLTALLGETNDALAACQSEAEPLLRDAARYRWLRQHNKVGGKATVLLECSPPELCTSDVGHKPHELDAAIDAEIAEQKSWYDQAVHDRRGLLALVDELRTERAALRERLAEADALLRAIAANTCCDSCREAALVAQSYFGPTDSADVVTVHMDWKSREVARMIRDHQKIIDAKRKSCPRCYGTGAVDAPTSADDPSCPDCDGEGTWAK